MRRPDQQILPDPALPADRVALWEDPGVPGLETTANRLRRHHFVAHTHDTAMIGLILAGSKTFLRAGRRHTVGPGEISFVAAGDLHTGAAAGEGDLVYRALYLPLALLAPQSVVSSATLCDPLLFTTLHRLSRSIAAGEGSLQHEELVQTSVAMLYARHGEPPPAPPPRATPRLERARDMLLAQTDKAVSITAIATDLGLSPFHLMHAFRRTFGMPMHAMRLAHQIERSRTLLRRTDRPIAEIALEAGFADQSHFTRRFRAQLGYTPAAYRRATRDRTASGRRL